MSVNLFDEGTPLQEKAKTAVLQSFRTRDVPNWISTCMDSVDAWANSEDWDYFRLDDAFLRLPEQWILEKCGTNIYAVTDVARLIWLDEVLNQGYERVVWADADMLVISPTLLTEQIRRHQGHGFAREVFLPIENTQVHAPRMGINNSLMFFERGDLTLKAYLNECRSFLLSFNEQSLPRTSLGPTLLTNYQRGARFNLIDGVGLLTPAIMLPLGRGDDSSFDAYERSMGSPIVAANLCHFMRNQTPPTKRAAFDRGYASAIHFLNRRNQR